MSTSAEKLAIVPKYLAVSSDQLALAKDTVARGLTNHEFELFVYNCQRQGVHPLDNLLIPVARTDNGVRKLSFTTTVDLLRSRAAETDEYAGNDDAVFDESGEKYPTSATMTVWRIVQGVRCPFTATARWSEYYPGEKQGFMWRSKPHIMIAKCAEALALRKAFPKQLAGMYATEEMQVLEDRPAPKKSKLTASMPASVELLTESSQPNRGHNDTGLQRRDEQKQPDPKPDPVMCGDCGKIDGHDESCKHYVKAQQDAKTSKPTVKAAYLVISVEKRTTKDNQAPYLVLDVADNANQQGKLYVWHKSLHEYLGDSAGKAIMCEVSEQKKGNSTYYQLEHLLEIAGQTFVDNMPVDAQGVALEEF